MNRYEQKQEERRERLEAAAERAEREARARLEASSRMADAIPFGQPILVGHHSEGRDRRFRERISRGFEKSAEASQRAAELRSRAASVGKAGISSDDPEAVDKLKEKLAAMEAKRDHMKEVNRLFRKGDADGLKAMGIDLEALQKRTQGLPSFDRQPYAKFELTNLGARIRDAQKRIEALEALAVRPEMAPIIGKGTVAGEPVEFEAIEDKEDNRLRITFSTGKPPEEIRTFLKARGFRFAPTTKSWQRQISNAATYTAEDLKRKLEG